MSAFSLSHLSVNEVTVGLMCCLFVVAPRERVAEEFGPRALGARVACPAIVAEAQCARMVSYYLYCFVSIELSLRSLFLEIIYLLL